MSVSARVLYLPVYRWRLSSLLFWGVWYLQPRVMLSTHFRMRPHASESVWGK